MEFCEIQKLVFEEYKKNGYLQMWDDAYETLKKLELEGIVDLGEMGLIVTEVSEAMEEVRDGDKLKMAKELAGIVIRIMNFASRKNIDLESFIIAEHKRNLSREKRHGRRI